MFVNDLLHMCEEYEDSENSKWLTSSLDWMNGREFDQYQSVCDDNKWQYTIIDSDLLEKKLVRLSPNFFGIDISNFVTFSYNQKFLLYNSFEKFKS